MARNISRTPARSFCAQALLPQFHVIAQRLFGGGLGWGALERQLVNIALGLHGVPAGELLEAGRSLRVRGKEGGDAFQFTARPL